ncbi:MAG: hypothetical protein LBH88_00405, partial [Candidatus Methanoplasma sp.]|nr:hypothetical protein [Candidatus Methanoplasma sp.]
MFGSNKSRNIAFAAIVLAIALVLVAAAVLMTQDDQKRPEFRDGVIYVDVDGSEHFSDPSVKDIDAAYLASASYRLDGGWYRVAGSFSLGNHVLEINGDVKIILANGVTVTGGTTV